jgi:hypothetical protein
MYSLVLLPVTLVAKGFRAHATHKGLKTFQNIIFNYYFFFNDWITVVRIGVVLMPIITIRIRISILVPIQIRIRAGIKMMRIHMRIPSPPSFTHVGNREQEMDCLPFRRCVSSCAGGGGRDG